jgi:hypothetical protein
MEAVKQIWVPDLPDGKEHDCLVCGQMTTRYQEFTPQSEEIRALVGMPREFKTAMVPLCSSCAATIQGEIEAEKLNLAERLFLAIRMAMPAAAGELYIDHLLAAGICVLAEVTSPAKAERVAWFPLPPEAMPAERCLACGASGDLRMTGFGITPTVKVLGMFGDAVQAVAIPLCTKCRGPEKGSEGRQSMMAKALASIRAVLGRSEGSIAEQTRGLGDLGVTLLLAMDDGAGDVGTEREVANG